jgi:hypothetical protein
MFYDFVMRENKCKFTEKKTKTGTKEILPCWYNVLVGHNHHLAKEASTQSTQPTNL